VRGLGPGLPGPLKSGSERKHKTILYTLLMTGMSGMVVLDYNGDREPDYWISDMDPTTGIFIRIAEVLNTDNGGRVLCIRCIL